MSRASLHDRLNKRGASALRYSPVNHFIALLCAVCFLVAPPAEALDPASSFTGYAQTTWTHKDGLPSTFIRSIAQSTDGYIWLGSTDGLIRFDGLRFLQWRAKAGDLRPLGVVETLCAAQDGSLWVGTAAGIIGHLRGESLSSFTAGAQVEGMLEALDGAVWVAAGNRLLQVRAEGEITVAAAFPVSARFLSGPLQDRNGSIWFSTEEGVEQLSPGHGENLPKRLASGRFWLNRDARGTIWAAGADGFTAPLGSELKVHPVSGRLDIRTTLRDSQGTTWIGTLGMGLARVRPDANLHPEIFRQADGLANDSVWALLEDRERNLWVGTQNGLSCFRDGKIKSLTKRDGLASDNIDALAAGSDGSVWAATSAGIDRIDGAHRELLLRGAKVMAVSVDRENRVWAGTGLGVVRLSGGRRDFIRLASGQQLINVTAIATGGADDVWLSDAAHGLVRWSRGRVDDFANEPLLRGKSILSAQADHRGRVWFGFYEGGIVVFEDGRFRAYSERDGLAAGAVTSVLTDDDGATWIATEAGLSRLDGSKFVTWTASDGLPGNRLLWVLSDRQGRIWLGFSFGVARVRRSEFDAAARNRPHRIEYDLLDNGDGLRGNPDRHWQSPAVRAADGTLWFRTSDGVAVIDPRRILKNIVKPPVQIESMLANGIRQDLANPIRLAPLTRDIQFDYTALSLVEPRRVRFRYMLEGFDSGWQEAGTRRQAFYTNLSPRQYRFRVLACNNDGVWNEAGAALSFDLLPAFYQTSGFGYLCVLAFVMLAWGAYRLRVWQLTSRLRTRFDERLAERTRIAQELHDSLFQSVLGISLQLEVADELLPAGAAAKKPVEKALRFSKGAMDEGRRALNDLRTQALGAEALVQAFSQVVKDFPAAKPPEVQILAEGKERPLNGVAGNDVLQIGRQAIANAFQHAHAGVIHVLLSYSRQNLCVRVKDNGRGIDENTLNAGKPGHHGIGGMRERARRIGATLSILSRAGEGTEVFLSVPGHLIYELEDRSGEKNGE